jgi:hypothetical protein
MASLVQITYSNSHSLEPHGVDEGFDLQRKEVSTNCFFPNQSFCLRQCQMVHPYIPKHGSCSQRLIKRDVNPLGQCQWDNVRGG